MAKPGHQPYEFVRQVSCPRCGAGVDHWCRENGRSVPPHPERGRKAVMETMRLFAPLTPRKKAVGE